MIYSQRLTCFRPYVLLSIGFMVLSVGCGSAQVDFYDEYETQASLPNGDETGGEPQSVASSDPESSEDDASEASGASSDDDIPSENVDEASESEDEAEVDNGSLDEGSSDTTDGSTDDVSDDSEAVGEDQGGGSDGSDCVISLRAEVRDQSGPCTVCTSGDYITVVGVVENSCSEALTYRSEKDCLVSLFDVYNNVAGSAAQYAMTCVDGVLLESLEPGNSVTQTRPAGRLSAGSYELTVQFENEERTARTLSFSVE